MIEDEEGADSVQDLLKKARQASIRILTSFVSFMEVFYITLQEKGEDEAHKCVELIKKLPLERIESSEEIGLTAGRLKAAHRISFADAWIAATAVCYNAILVHKDPEFDQLNGEITLLQLPYKSTAGTSS